MLVPVVLKASTSKSPAKVPPVIETVALVMLAPASGSETDRLPDSVTGTAFSVKLALAATWLRVGGASSGVIVMVVIAGALSPLEPLPSLTTQVTVRVGSLPWLVGSAPDRNVTESSTV